MPEQPSFLDQLGGVGIVPDVYNPDVNALYGKAGGMLPQLAGWEVAYNKALAPGLTDIGLGVEEQVAPGTFGLRSSAIDQARANLARGYRLPPELQDLVTTNALQQLGSSGAGASDLGKLFSARSLVGAGINEGQRNLENAYNMSKYREYFTPRQPFGSTPGNDLVSAFNQAEAQKVNNANLLADIEAQNSFAWFRTGARIVGTAVGGYFGGPMGAQAGANMADQAFKGSRVAGYGNEQQSGGGGGGMGGFGSILSGIGGGGGARGGGGGTAPGSSYTGPDSGVGFGQGAQSGMMYT